MPLVKSQTDIARPPRAGQGRQPAPAQGRAGRRARRDARSAARAATTTATSRCGTRAAATSSTTGSSTSSATRTASPAKVERLEYDPNRSAHLALLLLRRRRAPLHHRAARRRGGHAAHVGRGGADQAGQLPAAAQHPGRHDDPLRRDAAGQGRADRALGRRRRCSCSRAKASTRSCGLRSGEIRKVHVDCRADDRRSRQRRAQPALDRQGRRASAGAASARRCAASR